MKILVTGGCGMIGSYMVEKLLSLGHEVRILDLKEQVLKAKHMPKNIEIFQGNILKMDDIEKAARDSEMVVHMAAMLGVGNVEENQLKTLDVDLLGTRNVLEACRKNDAKKILFTSSSEVYGEPQKVPISETDVLVPRSSYGIAKQASEEYVKSFYKAYGLRYIIVRYFNIYGPRQSLDFVLPKFVKQALDKKPLTISGDGQQVRAFSHVLDAVNGTSLALFNSNNEIFNIGNDKEPITMKELAERIIRHTGSNSEIVSIPMEKSDRSANREIYKRIPDISKARKMLGYEPKISLDEGIKTMISYFKGG